MPVSRDGIARRGEQLAARALLGRGWRILHRNFRVGRGEVDLIAQDGDCLVFVEVKTRVGTQFSEPLEAVTRSKQRQLVRLAAKYMAARRLYDQDCRFDVVAVEMDAEGNLVRFDLIENAFQADGASFF